MHAETAQIGTLTLTGDKASTSPVNVLLRDAELNILFASGTTVPTDSASGYAKGCLFIDIDVATGTGGLYCNKGTKTSCQFTLVTQA